MEEFLGILFCGGKGKRLGDVTAYISKAYMPVYDRPAFKYPLALLERSKYIKEIAILTNEDNNDKIKLLGYRTVIQSGSGVRDMFTGLHFIKKRIRTKRHYVLMPCDNISNISVDSTIEQFIETEADIYFNLVNIRDRRKLSEMGAYDSERRRICYRSKKRISNLGVVAPYVVRNNLSVKSGRDHEVINRARHGCSFHDGFWFDIGDFDGFLKCNQFIAKRTSG